MSEKEKDKKEKKMLIKFENKSNRVKGLAFHPKRPWILASLHNGAVQLWDYRIEVMIDKFEEHDGPVRGVHFHSSQPLFVSGGDDYKIKVWNYQQKRCLFNLLGHLDYIRTVQFHPTYPWILSASDDQTIRIWNWQSRTCLSVLTGHNHYVMCAQFHPKEDLILSASLDQTVRVWDVSGLRKKTVSIAGEYGTQAPAADLFGASDVVVKHVLEGHSRGVNWAAFHPSLSLIVSGADDREVKLWRMNDSKAWEVDTMRGHINNVSCVLFHPKKELIISNSEDKSIRVWDISKQTTPVILRRDNDRYWILDAHPTLNLIAAGHDSGLTVFKLNRERPAYGTLDAQFLYYFKDVYVYEFCFKTFKERPVLSTRRSRGVAVAQPRTLHYNSTNRSQHNILLTTESDGSYELYVFQKGGDARGEEASPQKGYGKAAIFVSRNRFAVLDKSRQLFLKNLKNETKKKITIPNFHISHIFEGGVGRILIRSTDSMALYDIQSLRIVAELPVQSRHPIKYVVWSVDGKHVAMFSKTNIVLANSRLAELCTVSENTRIKSGAWDSLGVFVYTTATHIKYVVPNGDVGIIRTVENPIYITTADATSLTYIDREGKVGKLNIDTTEYQFKIALMNKNEKEVRRIMESKKLVGQSIISYLQQKGYPDVALHFAADDLTKFNLALECGDIAVALECATKLDKREHWHKLGLEALRQGNHQVVEVAYQKTKNFERLSFLYLATGNIDKLSKMLHIATLRGDLMGRFHNALYLGNARERVQVLREAGQKGLALLTARTHGLEAEAASILEEMGETAPTLPDVSKAKLFVPPNPILRESNWPQVEVKKGFFEEAARADADSDGLEEPTAPAGGEQGDGSDGEHKDGWGLDAQDENKGTKEDGGWDVDLPDVPVADTTGGEAGADEDLDAFVMPTAGKSAFHRWSNNSTLAADAVAGGAFDTAMHLLNRQIGVINFTPLKPLFVSIHRASRCYLPLLPGSLPLPAPITRSFNTEDDRSNDGPLLECTLPLCVDKLKLAYKAFTEGKFQEALGLFTEILHTLPLIVVDKPLQVTEVFELRDISREYVTAIRIELTRKATEDSVQQAQLAAYFTHCKLQPMHLILALRVALKCVHGIKNNKTTAGLCRRLLELAAVSSNQQAVAKHIDVKKIKALLKQCEEDNTDAHDIDFDESKSFTVCCETFTAVHKGKPSSRCPYCLSNYKADYDRSLCRTCQLSRIGAEATGMRVFPSN